MRLSFKVMDSGSKCLFASGKDESLSSPGSQLLRQPRYIAGQVLVNHNYQVFG